MANGHNSIKRIVHRSCEEIGATFRIARATSWPEAINTFRAKLDIQVMSRNGHKEPPAVKERLLRKHETVLKYLENRFGDFFESYDYDAPLPPSDPALEGKIWMCWWQGEENAPEIVRACIDSVRRNAGEHEVIVITDENLSDYAHIPDWVLEKVHAGIMSRTNLSDLLRLSLLAEHGGMWLDATFFCAGSLGEYMDLPIWSIKRPDYLHASVACGMFAGYSLACKKDQRHPFVVARDFFLEYWRNSDRLIDYLLVDYLIVLAQRHDPSVAAAFASIEPNNPRCDDLISVLDRPFDQSAWSELLLDTRLFKLTWKQEFPKQTDGRQTYYGRLLEGGVVVSKKKVLFVMSSMDNGGAERALLNLLEELPETRYDVNLLLLNPTGLFMGQIPSKVAVLQTPTKVRDCFTSVRGRKAGVWRLTADVVSGIVSRDEETRRGFRWKYFFSPAIDKIPGHYDVAVSFINGQVLYFVDEKIEADRKIVFYHGDYRSARYSEKYERPCLERMDGIYAVSDKCIDIVRSVFPEMAYKMKSLPNIVSSDVVRRRASEFIPPEYDADAPRILTVARITHEKGVDTAIRAAAELKQRGCSFRWYEMGKGLTGDSEQAACEKLVEELGVADVFTFLGARENPYPYIANCDIVVQPSRFEGKSVALDEAKILTRPIVATAYPTVHDQLGVKEGIIAGTDAVSLADAIQGLLENPVRRNALSARLASCEYGNAGCVADYVRVLEGDYR